MTSYQLLLYLHLLMFVYWLGADVGVFALAMALKNPCYSCAQRQQFMHLSLGIDLVPRVAFACISPVGFYLADQQGLIAVPDWLHILLWGFAMAWIIGEIVAFRHMGEPLSIRIYIGTGLLFVAGFLGFSGYGIISLYRGEPVAAGWLALKLLLFGLVFLISLCMARYYAPLEEIFRRMEREGSAQPIEAEVRFHVNRGGFFTVVLFVLLATIGFLGVVKPF